MCVQMQAHACGGWKWQWASYLTALPFLNISWHLLIVCVHLFVSNLSLSLTLSHCWPVCVYVCVHMHTCYDLPPLEVRGQLQGVISPSPNYILEIKLSLSVLVTNAFLQCTYYWSTTLFFFFFCGLLLSLPVSAFQVMELPVVTNPACFRCEFCESELLILQVCGMCFIYRVNSSATSLLIYNFCFFFDGEYRARHRRN